MFINDSNAPQNYPLLHTVHYHPQFNLGNQRLLLYAIYLPYLCTVCTKADITASTHASLGHTIQKPQSSSLPIRSPSL